MISRLSRGLIPIVILLILGLPACNFSTTSDITPPPGSELSAAGTAIPETEQTPISTTQTEAQTGQVEITAESVDSQQMGPAIGTIVFTGKVTNLSGGDVPEGLQVDLQGYLNIENVFTQTAVLNKDTTFEFSPLEVLEGQIFILTVEYKGVVFSSDIIDASSLVSVETWPVEIGIYENTTDLTGIFIDRAHIFISSISGEQMQVVVYLLISNPTRSVVTGEDGQPVLIFSLPANVSNLQLDDAGWASRFVALENGFGDTLSIRPGLQEHEILYSFEIPYDGKQDLSLVFPIPEESGTLIIPKGLRIKGDGLTDAGEREMSGGVVQLYSFGALETGQALKFVLSGREKGASGISSLTILLIGLGTFALVSVLSLLWLRRRSKVGEVNKDLAAGTSLQKTQDDILDSIISLDREYENGTISAEEYAQRREQLKSKLKDIYEN